VRGRDHHLPGDRAELRHDRREAGVHGPMRVSRPHHHRDLEIVGHEGTLEHAGAYTPALRLAMEKHVLVLGAGPAGLTAAHELADNGVASTVLEADAVVGGLARTESYKGYLYDIGGHRFFTKMDGVNRIWEGALGGDSIQVPRPSRLCDRP